MKDFAEKLYKSKAWQHCRKGYIKSVGGLCERCLTKGRFVPAVIVHHKIPVTANNIDDPTITLNWDNLQAVCRDCHAELHNDRVKRYKVDELGRIFSR
jgi:5-methylcytosine-specific restriction endonuclease McrA